MEPSMSRSSTAVVAAIFAAGCWLAASSAADAPGKPAAGPYADVPSASELLSLRSSLISTVYPAQAPTLSPPIWSQDGSQISYLGSTPGGSLGLWSINAG